MKGGSAKLVRAQEFPALSGERVPEGRVRVAATLLASRLTLISLLAVAALYLPTFYKLFSSGWESADYGHGPLILGAFCWLLWRRRQALLPFVSPRYAQGERGRSGDVLRQAQDERGAEELLCIEIAESSRIRPPLDKGGTGGIAVVVSGLLILLFGLLCYGIGSIHGSMSIEAFSMVPVLFGTILFLLGGRAARGLLFPLGFLLFLVPPPLAVTDMLTSPLKMLVATAAAALLKGAGYLVTRNGATLLVNDYSITVGDPCSGMRSLIALTSVGALYAHLIDTSKVKKALLFCSTLPISVLANVVRLMTLCLITYYLGEAAAEGFLHKFSGFVLFSVSLVLLFFLDVAMNRRRES